MGQDVALHGLEEVILLGPRLQVKLRVQRIELEEVPMGIAPRRARASVSQALEVVGAMSRAVGQSLRAGNPLWQLCDIRGIPYSTQWTHVPLGASGSSAMGATLSVPSGTSLHLRGGETSSPSQVYLAGMVEPSVKAVLVS